MLRVALVGLGDAGKHHARALSALAAEGQLVWSAVCARDRGRIDAFRAAQSVPDTVASFDGLATLIEGRACDAVILATPDGVHAEQVVAAAEAGLHVLVEKPLALEPSSAARALSSMREANLSLAVGYHLRHHAAHRLVRDRLQELTGEVRTLFLRWAWPDPATDGWRAKGQGARFWSLAALGTHCIDLVLWLTGMDASRVADHAEIDAVALRIPASGIDRAAEVTLRLGEVLAHISVSVGHRAVSRLIISGTDGEIEALGTFGARGDGEVIQRAPRSAPTPIAYSPTDPYVAQLRDFVAGALSGYRDDPSLIANVELLDRIARYHSRGHT